MVLTHHLMTMIIRQARYQQREEIPVHVEVSLLAGLHPDSVGLRPDNVDLKKRGQIQKTTYSAGRAQETSCQEKSSEEEKEKKSTASCRYFSCDSCDRWIDHVSVFV